ncbi:MAG: 50S ribosomal protein L30e [Candidatus Micrarchaeota archaeon]|nr:50S ribosomal protein L30e [Candidatus Micrarchaeota archaeon]
MGKILIRKRSKKSGEDPVAENLRLIAETGKVVIGSREAERVVIAGEAKALYIATNIPKETTERFKALAERASIPVVEYSTSVDLGQIIGRPHPVSVIAVLEPGEGQLPE